MFELKRSASTLGLDLASTNRLERHVRSHFVDKPDVRPLFDDRVYDMLNDYSVGNVNVSSEIKYLDSMKYGCYYSGSMLVDQIERFAGPEKDSFKWNRNYQKALNQVWEILKPVQGLKAVDYHSDDDIDAILTKKDTNAGWHSILYGKRSKGEYLDGIYSEYTKELGAALRKGTFDKPIVIGTRKQVSGAYDDESGERTGTFNAKTRLISMIDIIVIIAESQFAKPFQKYMHGKNFYAMGKLPDELHSLVVTTASKYRQWTSVDYSKYDQSIPSWLIRDAFDLIWRCFDGATHIKYSELFDVIVNDFINKTFISEGGRLVYSHKGVPSGSMFTSIIDTLCNLIIVHTYFNSLSEKLGEEVQFTSIICGDDNLICTKEMFNLDDYKSYIEHNFGIEIHVNKCKQSKRAGQPPEFLSRVWLTRGAYRNPKILLAKACYPENFRDYRNNPDLNPEQIIYSYILAYPEGMRELINVSQFVEDFKVEIPTWSKGIWKHQSGWLGFQNQYLM